MSSRPILKRRWWLLAAIVLVIGAAAAIMALLLPSLFQPDRRVATVRRGVVEATIRTIGRVQSARVLSVASPVTASVRLVAVRPGDRVERGDILAELDPTGVERDLARARTTVEAAELRLTAARLAASRADAGPNALVALYAAGQEVQNARAALAQAEEARRAAVLVAPFAATVVSVNLRERQVYGGGSEALVLNDLGQLQIAAEIDEVDLAAVLRGTEARVTLDAYPGQEFAGRVASIAPVAAQRQGSTVYPAVVEFTPPGGLDIRPGMSANVAIITAGRADTLYLPAAGVRRIGERRYVQLVRPGGLEQVEVKTGLEGNGRLEVLEGVSEGDVVALP